MPSPNVMASVRMSGSGGSKGDTVCHFDAPGVEGSYGPDGSSYLNHTTQVKCLTSLILTRPLIFDSEEQSALPSAIGLQSLEVERRYSGSYPPPERCQSLCNLPKMKDTQLPATRWQARSAFAEGVCPKPILRSCLTQSCKHNCKTHPSFVIPLHSHRHRQKPSTPTTMRQHPSNRRWDPPGYLGTLRLERPRMPHQK
jgi:hypothetical protein